MEGFLQRLRRARGRVPKPNQSGFVQLFVSKRLLHGSATALLGIFVPIFLYETMENEFYWVGGYYALLSFLYAMLLVPAMQVTNWLGFSRTLVLGGALSVVLYSIMFFLTPENVWYLIGPLTAAIVGFRLFHWVPFHVDFTLFTQAGKRGQQVSLSFATIAFMGVAGPILAGFIISHAGYQALFGVAVMLLIAATISYMFVPETNTHFEWTWRQTWRALLSRERRGVVLGEFANGAEASVNLIVWPVFLYEVLGGDVLEIGVVSTIVVGLTIMVQLIVGRYLDKATTSKARTLQIGSTLYALGWVLKIFVLSVTHVFLVGLYHNIVKIFTKTPFSAIIYDMSAEQGKYVDEFTVLREMSVHAGRASCLVLVSILAIFVPIGWTFLLAAIASIALNVVYRIQPQTQ
jgi:MFS family permease